MKLQIVAVLDRAVGAYGRPIFVRALGEALRSFEDEVNRKDSNNLLFSHPKDYAIFHLGCYHEDTGSFESLDFPVRLAEGLDCVLKPEV